jgi:hypothetical protein
VAPITRKEFYELAETCKARSLELARHDQNRVNLEQCRQFNRWLPKLKTYDQLSPALRTMTPARPITRWHMMGVGMLAWLLVLSALRSQIGAYGGPVFSYGLMAILLLLYFMPERFYGTTIELLEGKMLRIVETLEELLLSGEMGFTEAAFFQVKENLRAARRELRQQIDLAHRW